MNDHLELTKEPLVQKQEDHASAKFADEALNFLDHNKGMVIGTAAVGLLAAGALGARALVSALDTGSRNLARWGEPAETRFLGRILGSSEPVIDTPASLGRPAIAASQSLNFEEKMARIGEIRPLNSLRIPQLEDASGAKTKGVQLLSFDDLFGKK